MVLKPNMYYDEMSTQTRRRKKGISGGHSHSESTLIVNKWVEVSYQQIQLLNAYGLLAESDDDKFDSVYIGGTMSASALLLWVVPEKH